MLGGVGVGGSAMRKIELVKRLSDTGYGLQRMAVGSLREFLRVGREGDEGRRKEWEGQQRGKERILRRIVNESSRMAGVGFRQA
jgi:hypothetical protein